jgi:hypothetical protein
LEKSYVIVEPGAKQIGELQWGASNWVLTGLSEKSCKFFISTIQSSIDLQPPDINIMHCWRTIQNAVHVSARSTMLLKVTATACQNMRACPFDNENNPRSQKLWDDILRVLWIMPIGLGASVILPFDIKHSDCLLIRSKMPKYFWSHSEHICRVGVMKDMVVISFTKLLEEFSIGKISELRQ